MSFHASEFSEFPAVWAAGRTGVGAVSTNSSDSGAITTPPQPINSSDVDLVAVGAARNPVTQPRFISSVGDELGNIIEKSPSEVLRTKILSPKSSPNASRVISPVADVSVSANRSLQSVVMDPVDRVEKTKASNFRSEHVIPKWDPFSASDPRDSSRGYIVDASWFNCSVVKHLMVCLHDDGSCMLRPLARSSRSRGQAKFQAVDLIPLLVRQIRQYIGIFPECDNDKWLISF